LFLKKNNPKKSSLPAGRQAGRHFDPSRKKDTTKSHKSIIYYKFITRLWIK